MRDTVPDMIIDTVLILNGLYDLTCACSILWLGSLPGFKILSDLHANMFESAEHARHPVIRRLLAYWLLTYGVARTAAGIHRDEVLDLIGALTYLIEALCFEYESRVGGTLIASKVAFVSVTSLFLGAVVLSRSFLNT